MNTLACFLDVKHFVIHKLIICVFNIRSVSRGILVSAIGYVRSCVSSLSLVHASTYWLINLLDKTLMVPINNLIMQIYNTNSYISFLFSLISSSY